jgi:CheY-like chemotaxis protein
VPKTLLAVDDSATMRKVLEITFSGEDFNVVTASNKDTALGQLGSGPDVVVVDTVLGSEDGYAVAKEIRARDSKAVIILMASRYAPYDQAKGKDAGADDFMDKPFDTQQAIDKVKRAMVTRETSPSSPAVGTPAPAAAATPKPAAQPPRAPGSAPGAVLPINAKPTQGSMGQRSGTLVFGQPVQPAQPPVVTGMPPAASAPPAPPAPPAQPAHPVFTTPLATPQVTPPQITPTAATPAPAAAPAAAAAAATNGHFSTRLGELGLTAEQVQAVVALSREVVEKVVWEVVPQLAESMIKEEIARLTREG